jgi:hypothetical protein
MRHRAVVRQHDEVELRCVVPNGIGRDDGPQVEEISVHFLHLFPYALEGGGLHYDGCSTTACVGTGVLYGRVSH